jgi:hypothetical protein
VKRSFLFLFALVLLLNACRRHDLISTNRLLMIRVIPTGPLVNLGYRPIYIGNMDSIRQIVSGLNNASFDPFYFHNQFNIVIYYENSDSVGISCNDSHILINGRSYKLDVPALQLVKCCFIAKPPVKPDTVNYTDSIFRKKDSLCLLIDHKTYCACNDNGLEGMDTRKAYAGIYRVKGDSLRRSFSTVWGKYVLFTLNMDYQSDTGFCHGYLFAFDTVNKKWVTDRQFDRTFIPSKQGTFVLSAKTQKFSSVGTPGSLTKLRTEALMYQIRNDQFKYIRDFRFHDDIDNDSLVYFYKQSFGRY